jgi:hypothetical protein
VSGKRRSRRKVLEPGRKEGRKAKGERKKMKEGKKRETFVR